MAVLQGFCHCGQRTTRTHLSQYTAKEKAHGSVRQNQVNKLGKLFDQCDKPPLQLHPQELDRCMVKLMNQSLTALQRDVMSNGLNFPPTPTRLPLVDTIVAVEDEASQLKEDNM